MHKHMHFPDDQQRVFGISNISCGHREGTWCTLDELQQQGVIDEPLLQHVDIWMACLRENMLSPKHSNHDLCIFQGAV